MGGHLKILICEDDPGILEVVTLALESKGYTALQHATPDGLLQRMSKEKPHVLLLDLWLKNERGEDMVPKLKAKAKASGTSIVLMSANSSLPKIAKKHGVDYLTKPFNLEDLWLAIARNAK